MAFTGKMGLSGHDLGGRPMLVEQVAHHSHGLVDMREERQVARTEVVESIFASFRLDEAVLGAAAVTCKADRTDLAGAG